MLLIVSNEGAKQGLLVRPSRSLNLPTRCPYCQAAGEDAIFKAVCVSVKRQLLRESPDLAQPRNRDHLNELHRNLVVRHYPDALQNHAKFVNTFRDKNCDICGGKGFLEEIDSSRAVDWLGIVVGVSKDEKWLRFGDAVPVTRHAENGKRFLWKPDLAFPITPHLDELVFHDPAEKEPHAISYNGFRGLLFCNGSHVHTRVGNIFDVKVPA